MGSADQDQEPNEPQPLCPDTAEPREPPPNPAITCNIDDWDEPDFDEEPPDDISIHDERAPWEGKWKETKYDSFEDARQNVSHVGDSKQDYEHIHESDDHTTMSGESVRRRGTDEWIVPESLY